LIVCLHVAVSGNKPLETMETSREEEKSVDTVVADIEGGSSAETTVSIDVDTEMAVKERDDAALLAVNWEHVLDILRPCFIEFLLPREVNCLSRASSSLKDYPKDIEHLRWIRGPRSINHLCDGIKQIPNLRSLDLTTSQFKRNTVEALLWRRVSFFILLKL